MLWAQDCHTTLRALWKSLTPGLVFAAEGAPFVPALMAVADSRVEVVTCASGGPLATTPFGDLEATVPTSQVEEAHRSVGPSTIAKILYTSGSFGKPKGVINTQRMLCANQPV